MKTKYKYLIIISIITISIAVYFSFAFNSFFGGSIIEYSDFKQAVKSGKKVQIIGSWVKDSITYYNSQTNTFSFYMKDKNNSISRVILNGSKPSNFNVAPYFVVKGKFIGKDFISSEIYLKCPSKYEGQYNKLKGS